MKVKLLDYDIDAMALVASGASVCFSNKPIETIFDDMKKDPVAAKKMIRKIFEYNHFSCFEHMNFTFAIGDISRIISHQLVRHRLTSPHERSQRHVDPRKAEGSEYAVIPKVFINNEEALEKFINAMKVTLDAYSWYIDNGYNEEDARYVLLGSSKTSIILTLNGRSLIHFFNLRCCNRAQDEHREVAILMLNGCRKVLPDIFNQVGPNCYMKGICPEGKLCCGKMKEVQNKFSRGVLDEND